MPKNIQKFSQQNMKKSCLMQQSLFKQNLNPQQKYRKRAIMYLRLTFRLLSHANNHLNIV